ncbi:hypothetical protein, partial [Anaerosporobacter sp.]
EQEEQGQQITETETQAETDTETETEKETETQNATEKSTVTQVKSEYVLTPDIIKEVKARVNALDNLKQLDKSADRIKDEPDNEATIEEKTSLKEQSSSEENTAIEEQESKKENSLTEDELQKMKDKMQKIQEDDVIKTYRHDSPDIVEDGDVIYAYGVNLNTIFQNFINNESIKNQLLSILKNMDSRKQCNNFMVCGDIQTGKTSLARAIAIAMWKLNRIPTKKVAKISASKLNNINLLEKMEQLADGSLVIENASLLNSSTVKSIIHMIEHYDGRILVLFEDRTRNMEELMNREQDLRTFFTHRIILPRYTLQDITDFAYSMIKQQEYEVAEGAMEYLEIKIEQIYRVTPTSDQLEKVKVYVGELIKKAETRNMFLLMKQAKEGKFSQSITNVITIDDIID